MKVKIQVKCVSCKNKRDAKPNEITADLPPQCEECGMPMVAEKVQVKRK